MFEILARFPQYASLGALLVLDGDETYHPFPHLEATKADLRRDVDEIYAVFSGAAANWTPVEVVNPLTGEPMTVFNLIPQYFGLAPDIYLTNAASSDRRNIYTGVELSTTARLRGGSTVLAGWNIERTVAVTCDSADDPNTLRFCDQRGVAAIKSPSRRIADHQRPAQGVL